MGTGTSPIDDRYGTDTMRCIWDGTGRCRTMGKVEYTLMLAQSGQKIIPRYTKPFPIINVGPVRDLEKEYGHEVVGLVAWLEKETGYPYWHFGVTSSDIVDTAVSVQIREASDIIDNDLVHLMAAVQNTAKKYAETACLGRTHGQAAVPMTFGHKFAVFYSSLDRCRDAFADAVQEACVAKISGAVGNYAWTGGEYVERIVATLLSLRPARFSTQIFPRDAMARVVTEIGILSSVLENIANEVRNLSRTGIEEVFEPRNEKAGSSTMVQKRNPIKSEKVCGLARVIRGHVSAMLENIVSDHERDLRNSSVERMILPEIFLLLEEQLLTLGTVISGLQIDVNRMLKNLEVDNIYAESLLIKSIRDGVKRMKAYEEIKSVIDNPNDALWVGKQKTGYFNQYIDGSANVVKVMPELGAPKDVCGCAQVGEHCPIHSEQE
jgi:adenylosuccinate lyase